MLSMKRSIHGAAAHLLLFAALGALVAGDAHAQICGVTTTVRDNDLSIGDVTFLSLEGDESKRTIPEAYVFIDWRALASDGETVLHAADRIPAGFRVGCVSPVGQGRLLVAGESWGAGTTVIQLWELRDCIRMTGVPPDATDDEVREFLLPRGIRRISVIQESDLATQERPIWACALPSTTEHVLVGYLSGHVWELATGPGEDRLIASPDGDQELPVLPIGLSHVPLYAADHTDHGRFVLLVSEHGAAPMLLFVDSDRDGEVDVATTLDEETRIAMELDNLRKHQ